MKPIKYPKNVMVKLIELCKRSGYLFPSSEIYGGLRGGYDYGPLGLELKKNISSHWWYRMVTTDPQVMGLDTSILNSSQVFSASGHLKNFTDELVDDILSKERFRPDKAGELRISGDKEGDKYIKIMVENENDVEGFLKIIESNIGLKGIKHQIKNKQIKLFIKQVIKPDNSNNKGKIEFLNNEEEVIEYPYNGYVSKINSPFLTESRKFNCMFKTFLDPIDPLQRLIESPNPKETLEQINNTSVVYLRPETAQGVFINYLYCLRFAGNKIPFGVAQLGKSFRNELRVEHMIFRTLEFEQMELQFFTLPKKANEWFDIYVQKRMDWWFELVNNKELFRKRKHEGKELAHYAKGCTDVEFMFPWGWGELEGVANRGDFDLKSHMNASGRNFKITDNENINNNSNESNNNENNENDNQVIPYVIESSSGLNRACLAILLDAFTVQQDRIILKLNPKIAPIKVGICPLINKEEFNNIAEQLNNQFLIKNISTKLLNQQLKIGKKYYRMDEIGTPYCITIDYQTLEDEMVTIRFRDTQKQIRVNVNQVVNHIHELLNEDVVMKPITINKVNGNNNDNIIEE